MGAICLFLLSIGHLLMRRSLLASMCLGDLRDRDGIWRKNPALVTGRRHVRPADQQTGGALPKSGCHIGVGGDPSAPNSMASADGLGATRVNSMVAGARAATTGIGSKPRSLCDFAETGAEFNWHLHDFAGFCDLEGAFSLQQDSGAGVVEVCIAHD